MVMIHTTRVGKKMGLRTKHTSHDAHARVLLRLVGTADAKFAEGREARVGDFFAECHFSWMWDRRNFGEMWCGDGALLAGEGGVVGWAG